MAFFLLGMIMLINFEDVWAGRVCVFVPTYLMALLGIVVMELDDPNRSVWFKVNIPDFWMEVDIKKYFTDGETKDKTMQMTKEMYQSTVTA